MAILIAGDLMTLKIDNRVVAAARFSEHAVAGGSDAVDISDLPPPAQVASQAEAERCIVEMERKRLRMEEAEKEGG